MISFYVYGTPAPQGSKRHVGGGVMIESSKHVRPWRDAVRASAVEAIAEWQAPAPAPFNLPPRKWVPMTGPLRVTMEFVFHRPQSHYRTGRNADMLRDSAPYWPSGRPDLSKLVRSTEDALTDAGVWLDDAQVVDYQVTKIYARHDVAQRAGVYIEVHEQEDPRRNDKEGE